MFLISIKVRSARTGQRLGIRLRSLQPYISFFPVHRLYIPFAIEIVK